MTGPDVERQVQHIPDDRRRGLALCGIEMPRLPFGPVQVHEECWQEWRRRRAVKRAREAAKEAGS